jgi:hypothetical protein
MTAISEPKSSAQNRLEGFALSVVLLGFPTYAAAVLIIKLMGAHEIVGTPGGAAIFVVLASIAYALLSPPLARLFPKIVRYGYEPVFYDARLSVTEKVAQWRTQPTTSVQLVSNVLLLSLLAVGVASMR